jgi:hypothetical protein
MTNEIEEAPSSEDAVQIPSGGPHLALAEQAFAEDPIAVPVLVLDSVIVPRVRAYSSLIVMPAKAGIQ